MLPAAVTFAPYSARTWIPLFFKTSTLLTAPTDRVIVINEAVEEVMLAAVISLPAMKETEPADGLKLQPEGALSVIVLLVAAGIPPLSFPGSVNTIFPSVVNAG